MKRTAIARIEPIQAPKIRFPMNVSGVFEPQLLSTDSIRVSPETAAHALACAKKLVARLEALPHTAEAGDLLAMAYTIISFMEPEADR